MPSLRKTKHTAFPRNQPHPYVQTPFWLKPGIQKEPYERSE